MKAASETSMLRILCISPLFVPFADAEAFCSAKIVQALSELGASVTVLASHDIRRSGAVDESHLWRSLQEVTVDVPQLQQPDRLRSVVTALRFQTPFFARWVERVVSVASQLHHASKFDLVYSRSLPMIAHVAGYWFSRKPKLPWVANVNDPWEIGLFPGVQTDKLPACAVRSQIFWLKRTLLNADLVTYPCQGLHRFHAKLAALDHPAQIVPHIGYRPRALNHHQNGQFRLVHAGKLGTNEVTRRSSRALLLGLKAFLDSSPDAAAQTKLVFVGPEDQDTKAWISDLGLAEHVETVGRVSYEGSLDHIASASVCILIESGTDESIFFPSKLADYLISGRPVLALSPPAGIAADFAKRGELIRIDHEPEAVRHTIDALYSEFKLGTLDSRKPTAQFITQLQGRTVAQDFLAACRTLDPRIATHDRPTRLSANAAAEQVHSR